jgi:integrase/recombinase XerD
MKTLQDVVEEYIAMRRGLGYKLKYESKALVDFVSFLEREGSSYITIKLALCWALRPKNVQPAWRAKRLSYVRNFARYCSAIDPQTEIPPFDLLPCRYQRPIPQIYTNDQIIRLLDAAKNLPPVTSLRRWTYHYLFGLLSVTGLRLSEAINLDCDDVDLNNNMLTILETKFNKSRLVPIHTSTSIKLEEYIQRRDAFLQKRAGNRFFLSELGKPLKISTVLWTFRKLAAQIGLRSRSDCSGPRPHGFRHTFATNSLLTWYRDCLDVEQCMPRLSTFLGHANVTGTYWYLSSVPELLALTATLLEKRQEELS